MFRNLSLIIALAICLGDPLVSLAQFGNSGSGSGGGGMGGGGMSGGGLGGGGLGGGGMGGGGLGGGGMGGGGLGGGGIGGGGMGGAGGGMGGAGGFGGQQGGANGMGGQQQQGQGFLGRNTNQQNQFLGRNTQAQGQGANGMQNQTGNRRGGANRNANQQNMNGQQFGGQANASGATRQGPQIRPRQKVAFDYPEPQMALVSVQLETRLNSIATFKSINLSVDPTGELVLKGEVASLSDAKLAENLARIEPGVQKIRNELTYPEPVEE